MGSRRSYGVARFYHIEPSLWMLMTAVLTFATAANRCPAQLCGQLSGVNFSENFNSLAISGANNQISNLVPFAISESGSSGNVTYEANDGSLSTGNTYSYGTSGSSDRALGEITSSTVQTTIGACFTNNTNHAITSFLVTYTGEEWRLGAADATLDKLIFEYSTNAESINDSTNVTWIPVTDLDFTTPNNTTVGAKNGNSALNRTVIGPIAITPASAIQPEATFYIHWLPNLISGANDGLAVDDLTIGMALAPGIAGDYNNNGVVDTADYVVWRKNLNQSVAIPNDITPGTVVAQDHTEWKNRFGKNTGDFGAGAGGAVPEPSTCVGFLLSLCFAMTLRPNF